jgi:hypothetical protein
MLVIDEYLGDCGTAARSLDHFLALGTAHGDVGFLEAHILIFQESLCPETETAGEFCIYFNFRHISFFLPSVSKWAAGGWNSSNPKLH